MRRKQKGEKKELQSSPHSLVVELPLANVGHSGFLSFPLLSSNANAINVMQCAVALQMHLNKQCSAIAFSLSYNALCLYHSSQYPSL